jgi:hypothetical protein
MTFGIFAFLLCLMLLACVPSSPFRNKINDSLAERRHFMAFSDNVRTQAEDHQAEDHQAEYHQMYHRPPFVQEHDR